MSCQVRYENYSSRQAISDAQLSSVAVVMLTIMEGINMYTVVSGWSANRWRSEGFWVKWVSLFPFYLTNSFLTCANLVPYKPTWFNSAFVSVDIGVSLVSARFDIFGGASTFSNTG